VYEFISLLKGLWLEFRGFVFFFIKCKKLFYFFLKGLGLGFRVITLIRVSFFRKCRIISFFIFKGLGLGLWFVRV